MKLKLLPKKTGAILNEKPESDDASKFSFYGSTLVCVATSKEELLEKLSKDIYTTSGVWDLDNVSFYFSLILSIVLSHLASGIPGANNHLPPFSFITLRELYVLTCHLQVQIWPVS